MVSSICSSLSTLATKKSGFTVFDCVSVFIDLCVLQVLVFHLQKTGTGTSKVKQVTDEPGQASVTGNMAHQYRAINRGSL